MIIGYYIGVFDMFNIEHLNLLRLVKEQCDTLIVGVITDEFVKSYLNKTPIISFDSRCAIVEAIKYVDYVLPQGDNSIFLLWKKYHFNRIFIGTDLQGVTQLINEKKQFDEVGVEFVSLLHSNSINNTILEKKGYNSSIQDNIVLGYTTGVYDMFHIGHLNILRRAKDLCGYLIVGVSTDQCVEEYKFHKPVVPYEQRAAIVAAIKYVDEVVPQSTMDKLEFLKNRHFDVMFHGDEWKGTDLYNKYEKEFAQYGARIEYLSHTEGISSSILRTKILNN